MRRNRKTRRERNNQKKKIILFSVGVICLLSVGYAAFSSEVVISGKGRIVENNAANYLRSKVVNSGDGIYKDLYEDDRYVYKGTNPNNFINFNGELWRIIAVEPDNTLKIIKKNSLGTMVFDNTTNRNNDENTYCNRETTYDGETKYWGCNIWNKRDGIYSDGVYSGTINNDATLNKYLNVEYYSTLSEDKKYIESHSFYVGKSLGNNSYLNEIYNEEKKEIWNGSIGLMNESDFMKASTNSECVTITNSRSASNPCSLENGNYLDELKLETWTINSYPSTSLAFSTSGVRTVSYYAPDIKGGISGFYSTREYHVRPVLFLKSNINLSGEGTQADPYIINEE